MNLYRDSESPLGRGIWHGLNRLMILAVILALVVFLWLICLPLFKDQHSETARIEQLRAEVADEKRLLAKQQLTEKLLNTDPAYVETVARDKLDMMKPGETIIRFEPGSAKKN